MTLVSDIPYNHPSIHAFIAEGLIAYHAGKFKKQLPEHHSHVDVFAILKEVNEIRRAGSTHPFVGGEGGILRRLSYQEINSLETNMSESDETIHRIARKARGVYLNAQGEEQQLYGIDGQPFQTTGVCIWGMVNNNSRVNPHLTLLAKALRDNPNINIGFVVNFPEGHSSPKDSANSVKACIKQIRSAGGISNQIDVDVCLHVTDWVKSFKEDISKQKAKELRAVAQEKLLAVYHACHKEGVSLTVTQQASAHPVNPNWFESLYDSSFMALNLNGNGNGANWNKNGTGFAIERPLNNFSRLDNGFPELLIPIMLATRDFNLSYANNPDFVPRGIKYSGEIASEVDAAVYEFIHQQILGSGVKHVNCGAESFYNRQLEAVRDINPGRIPRIAFDDLPVFSVSDPFKLPNYLEKPPGLNRRPS